MTLHRHPHKGLFYWLEGIFAAVQVGLAKLHAVLIKHNLPINHILWALITAAIIVAGVLIYKKRTHCTWWKAIKFGFALLLIRFVMFTPFLNLFRHKKIFYLGQGSAMDRWMTNIFPWLWGSATAGLLILQIL